MTWFRSQKQACVYCDILDFRLDNDNRRPLRGFTIDRKDSNLPYTIQNICLACWSCNRLKSDIFTFDEWREVAQKFIRPKWMKKLEVVNS